MTGPSNEAPKVTLILIKRRRAVTALTLNDPGRHNALDNALLAALRAARGAAAHQAFATADPREAAWAFRDKRPARFRGR